MSWKVNQCFILLARESWVSIGGIDQDILVQNIRGFSNRVCPKRRTLNIKPANHCITDSPQSECNRSAIAVESGTCSCKKVPPSLCRPLNPDSQEKKECTRPGHFHLYLQHRVHRSQNSCLLQQTTRIDSKLPYQSCILSTSLNRPE